VGGPHKIVISIMGIGLGFWLEQGRAAMDGVALTLSVPPRERVVDDAT